ncbi:MAG: MFS transporter, partial [Bdellovibrionales bacterium]|nr:MFS transporter [Bdellovibrionales bacterium]NQZ19875.1 MFS transporter [Bdellovibrionales bacterium]
MKKRLNKAVWGWSLYDWGNSAFATTVVAVFFPIFFKKYWASGLEATESTFYLGTTMSIAALLFAVTAPILGSFADIYGVQKRGLLIFAILGSLASVSFFFVPQGAWAWALIVYSIGWLGFTGGNLFYDSLLISVTDEEHFNWVSCLGYGLGYLGGGVLVVINAMMVTKPEMFGFANAAEGVKWAFVSVGLWWFVFTIPLLIWLKEAKAVKPKAKWTQGFSELWSTLQKIKKERTLLIFLIAYFFYIDGVHTIYKMAVDFALSINLQSADLI